MRDKRTIKKFGYKLFYSTGAIFSSRIKKKATLSYERQTYKFFKKYRYKPDLILHLKNFKKGFNFLILSIVNKNLNISLNLFIQNFLEDFSLNFLFILMKLFNFIKTFRVKKCNFREKALLETMVSNKFIKENLYYKEYNIKRRLKFHINKNFILNKNFLLKRKFYIKKMIKNLKQKLKF
jgi:hypothetical protein